MGTKSYDNTEVEQVLWDAIGDEFDGEHFDITSFLNYLMNYGSGIEIFQTNDGGIEFYWTISNKTAIVEIDQLYDLFFMWRNGLTDQDAYSVWASDYERDWQGLIEYVEDISGDELTETTAEAWFGYLQSKGIEIYGTRSHPELRWKGTSTLDGGHKSSRQSIHYAVADEYVEEDLWNQFYSDCWKAIPPKEGCYDIDYYDSDQIDCLVERYGITEKNGKTVLENMYYSDYHFWFCDTEIISTDCQDVDAFVMSNGS